MARARRSAEETRELMLESGLAMLQKYGIEIGVDELTLESACIEKDIARSSSHAAWAIDDRFTPQETFQRAVLERWLEETDGSIFSTAANDAIGEVLSEDPDNLSQAIHAACNAAFLEGLRRYHAGDGDFISTDMAMRFAMASQQQDERDPELFEWVRSSDERNRRQRVEDLYRPMSELLGVEPKPSLGEDAYEYFAVALATFMEGFTLRKLLSPEFDFVASVGPSPNGDFDESIIGACVEALIPVFFQPKDS